MPITQRSVPAPTPGLYDQIPFTGYREWDATNNSGLSILHKTSAAHLFTSFTAPDTDTVAKTEGRALHTLVIEPHLFKDEYKVSGTCCADTKGGKGPRCTKNGVNLIGDEWYCKVHTDEDEDVWGGTVLPPKSLEVVKGCRESIMRHPAARKLIDGATARELSGVWDELVHDDPNEAVRCKMRVDLDCPNFGAFVDIKTTADAAPDPFQRSIATYGYHRQAEFYRRGMKALGEERDYQLIVAVEKVEPFAVAVFRVAENAMDLAGMQLDLLLDTVRKCEETGVWPAYSDEVRDISLPPWEFKNSPFVGVG